MKSEGKKDNIKSFVGKIILNQNKHIIKHNKIQFSSSFEAELKALTTLISWFSVR